MSGVQVEKVLVGFWVWIVEVGGTTKMRVGVMEVASGLWWTC